MCARERHVLIHLFQAMTHWCTLESVPFKRVPGNDADYLHYNWNNPMFSLKINGIT